MLDPRFPPDTLFLTFEQDFRWYERDCLEVDEWLPMCVNTDKSEGADLPPPTRLGGADRPPSERDGAAASSSATPEQLRQQARGHLERVLQPTKPWGLDREVSPEFFPWCRLATWRREMAMARWCGSATMSPIKNVPEKRVRWIREPRSGIHKRGSAHAAADDGSPNSEVVRHVAFGAIEDGLYA